MGGTISSLGDMTYKGAGSVIKILPTGTVFVFQFLNPVFTNEGACTIFNKYLTAIHFAICGTFCVLTTFTDSYIGIDRKPHYGIATMTGLWPSCSSADSLDLSSFRLRWADFVHAFFALIIFGVLALFDSDTVECLYPEFKLAEHLLKWLPSIVGVVSGSMFVVFPWKRHGIGYPSIASFSHTTSHSTLLENSHH